MKAKVPSFTGPIRRSFEFSDEMRSIFILSIRVLERGTDVERSKIAKSCIRGFMEFRSQETKLLRSVIENVLFLLPKKERAPAQHRQVRTGALSK